MYCVSLSLFFSYLFCANEVGGRKYVFYVFHFAVSEARTWFAVISASPCPAKRFLRAVNFDGRTAKNATRKPEMYSHSFPPQSVATSLPLGVSRPVAMRLIGTVMSLEAI